MTLASFRDFLPVEVLQLLRSRVTAEFATISAAGVPIDTPTFFFPNSQVTTLDIGTGLAYPAKAERARREPRVGMLVEGEADQPVILISGRAAVHDADIQANLERYLAETIFSPNVDPAVVPWEKTRELLYYLARIIVAVAPVRVRWWPNRAAMDEAPAEWRADPGTQFPLSDPAPAGAASSAPAWRQTDWQELADQAVAGGMPAHLTLIDDEGFPAPVRVRSVERTAEGFHLTVPASAPWSNGKASLSFVGKEILVGHAMREGHDVSLAVERGLPVLPMMDNRRGPGGGGGGGGGPAVLNELYKRLEAELARRGQPMPVVPATPPEPTEGALLRAGITRAMDRAAVGGGIAR